MTEPYMILFITGFLLLTSIFTSKISGRVGVPALIVFLCVGMLAGSEGPGGIHFDDTRTANLVGTIALAFILFSGGLDTNWRLIRPVFRRGIILSTFGVAITAGLVGLFIWKVLGLPPLVSLLIGSIISSTDAAAVFSILRARGVSLKGNLKPLLEFESGSNDPMAIFLTIGMTQLLTVENFEWQQLIPAFFINMLGGVVMGLAAGKLASVLFNRIRLDYEGLYPVLSIGMMLATFGLTESLKGNGFLAVYICGVILNGADFAHKRFILKFHDGLAWLMQIAMFVVLGLLVFPSQLPGVGISALLVATFLMFVARPVAVAIGLAGSSFPWAERTLIAWTGLRGAVPIVLATFPFTAGYENSDTIFNIVFFIVLTSVTIQGTLLMPVARLLKVDKPLPPAPKYLLEIERQGQAQGETRELEILPDMAVVGKTVADLGIPSDVLILLIGRGDGFVVPRGQTIIEPYDTLLMLGDTAALRRARDIVMTPPAAPPKIVTPVDPLSALPLTTSQKYLSKQVVLVGYGRVGRRICDGLAAEGIPFVVADQNREIIEQLRARGVPAVLGDASTAIVLAQAHIQRAAILIIATPDTMKLRQMVDTAKAINPNIEIVVRTHSEMEAALLKQEKTGTIFLGEEELANSIARHVMAQFRDVSQLAKKT
ncbi:MAG: potassium/proton antiporter [Candidatus Hydrogenedentes bacterium]|nr:potassium/proton antiporter [Candidatus Hydrogenedentota bacterium]